LGNTGLGRALADPDLQKRGAKFVTKFLNDLFLGISRKNFCIPHKIPHLSPKISDDFFLVINLFRVLYGIFPYIGGAKSVADIATGGPNSLLFHKITILPLLFLSRRGAKLHCQFQWGRAMAGFAPPGSATEGENKRKSLGIQAWVLEACYRRIQLYI